MLIHITSGSGPFECKVAALKLADALIGEFDDTTLLTMFNSEASLLLDGPDELASVAGTVCWECQSPIRPISKCTRWYVQVRVIPTLEELNENSSNFDVVTIPVPNQLEGVNDVGVRVTHKATGLVVACTDEDKKFKNEEIAFARMRVLLDERLHPENKKQPYRYPEYSPKKSVRVYKGEHFILEKKK